MAVKSKVQLAADIAASTFTAPQQVILDDMVDSYQDLSQGLTTVQIAAIPTPASGQLVYNTDLSQFQYYNGTQWVGLGTLLEKQVVISAAELATLATTPVDLIDAVGAGLAINIISYTRKTSFGTTPYDFAAPLGICASSNTGPRQCSARRPDRGERAKSSTCCRQPAARLRCQCPSC